MICAMPHVIYGYAEQTYSDNSFSSRIGYMSTLGLFWCQYGINIAIYVGQRGQYWDAYKDYIHEVILPIFTFKLTSEDEKSNSDDVTLRRIQELTRTNDSAAKPLNSSRS